MSFQVFSPPPGREASCRTAPSEGSEEAGHRTALCSWLRRQEHPRTLTLGRLGLRVLGRATAEGSTPMAGWGA